MAALTQRPQARAAALIATAQALGIARAREIGGTPEQQALTTAKAEAAQLRGYVHSLCFEAHELRAALTPKLGADTFTVASKLDDQAVVLEYSAEWVEGHRGGHWDVACRWVHLGGLRLDASPVGGPLKREVAARFQAECEAHFNRQPKARRVVDNTTVLGPVVIARAA
jgi:hypothetical protein